MKDIMFLKRQTRKKIKRATKRSTTNFKFKYKTRATKSSSFQ